MGNHSLNPFELNLTPIFPFTGMKEVLCEFHFPGVSFLFVPTKQ
jgi:hypothetical protein